MLRHSLCALILFNLLTPLASYSQVEPETSCTGAMPDDYYGVGLRRGDAERQYREYMRQQFPDLPSDEFNALIEYGKTKQRARMLRKQALCIQIREQYPNLSKEERDILVADAFARQAAQEARLDEAAVPPPPDFSSEPSILSCIQSRIGQFGYVDCY